MEMRFDAVKELVRICETDRLIMSNDEYAYLTRKCIDIFNHLKVNLTDEQKHLLFLYDDLSSNKERLVIDILMRRDSY